MSIVNKDRQLTVPVDTLPVVTTDLTDVEVQPEFVVDFSFVKQELLDSLEYLDGQIKEIEEKTKTFTRFSRNVFETKKLFVEQRLNVLKQLQSLAIDKKKLTKDSGSKDLNISDILGNE